MSLFLAYDSCKDRFVERCGFKEYYRVANVVIYRLSGGVKWGLLAKPEKS